jgi:Ca2+-binding EF-hand superfamily protein
MGSSMADRERGRNEARERHHVINFVLAHQEPVETVARVKAKSVSEVDEGVVDEDLLRLCKTLRSKLESKNITGKAFSKFDHDGDGTVTTNEFLDVLKESFNMDLSTEQEKKLVDYLDDDHNGNISYHELSSKLFNDVSDLPFASPHKSRLSLCVFLLPRETKID